MMSPTTGILLAAGLGTRLAPLTDLAPKCLTELWGRPLLDRAIEVLLATGVTRIVTVVGYRAEQIERFIGARYPGADIRCVANPDYASTGTALSLACGLTALSPGDDALLVEADVVFEAAVLDRLLCCTGSATALARYRSDLTGTFALVDEASRLTDWAHESVRPAGFPLATAWKTVNLTRFDAAAIDRHLRPALADVLATRGSRSPFEFVAQRCIRDLGLAMHGVDVSDLLWYEIDSETDLQFAQKLFAPAPLAPPPAR